VDWEDHWEQLGPPAPPPRARKPGVWTIALVVLGLMGLLLAALHWRGWLAAGRQALAGGAPVTAAADLPRPAPADRDAAHFSLCAGPHRVNCVIDGDTIWYAGEKIRLADINAPEVSDPDCDAEQLLGEKATDRLLALLNMGAFSLVPLPGRDTDVYGRKLRTISRGGQSLGMVLVKEGLAEKWVGFRRDWCD